MRLTNWLRIAKLSRFHRLFFAEMVKGKPWTPTTLREIGGTEGVGVTFLEETFSSPQANPKHRLHQKGAQAVLKALLPGTGADIKGQMRSERELEEAAAYSDRPRDFAELMRVLDRELRLITPTDPEGSSRDGQQTTAGGQYYQLGTITWSTHFGTGYPASRRKRAADGPSCGWQNEPPCGSPSPRTGICRRGGSI